MNARQIVLLAVYAGASLVILNLMVLPRFLPESGSLLDWRYEQLGVQTLTTSGPLIAAAVGFFLWTRLSDQ